MKVMPSDSVFIACLMAATLFSGCSHKKVAAAPQPAPPTATAQSPEAQPTPAEQTQNQESQPATQGTPPPETQPAQPDAEKADANKAKTAKPKPTPKKGGSETARNTPPKKVVNSDSANAPSAGQISPSLSHNEVIHDQATTEQLLQSTEASLNGIKRQLSTDEQAVVAQIRDYMNQSRQATKANDLTRAYNLALKARLLSDDLAKQH